MTEYTVDESPKTPYIHFEDNRFIFRGKSIPEDARKFYRVARDKAKDYLEERVGSKTQIEFHFEYCDTSTVKWIVDFLRMFESCQKKNPAIDISVIWKYESDDEEMLDLGEFIQAHSVLPFTFIPADL
ncbi:MAG: DUF1987 domain-containing protein [Bacteroidota bacterium]